MISSSSRQPLQRSVEVMDGASSMRFAIATCRSWEPLQSLVGSLPQMYFTLRSGSKGGT